MSKKIIKLDHVLVSSENLKEKKKRIKELSCDKLIVTFNYFVHFVPEEYRNIEEIKEEKKKEITGPYFDIRDLIDICKNENITEIEYKYQGLYGLDENVLNVIGGSVQAILSFVFAKSYHFKELIDIIVNNSFCRILKISGAHCDELHLHYRNIETIIKLKTKNFVLLEIQGLYLSGDDVGGWLERNKRYFKNTQERVKKENLEKVAVLREKFYFPKDISNLFLKKLDSLDEFPLFDYEKDVF